MFCQDTVVMCETTFLCKSNFLECLNLFIFNFIKLSPQFTIKNRINGKQYLTIPNQL